MAASGESNEKLSLGDVEPRTCQQETDPPGTVDGCGVARVAL